MANKFFGAIAVTGGTAGALDAIDGNQLSDGDGATVITSTAAYIYHLNASSGAAESSPDIIAPDSNAGNKRWILVGSFSLTIGSIATLSATENSDVDIGAEVIDSFADTDFDSAIWHYTIKNSANLRCGTVMATWDASSNSIVYSERSTSDIGDTGDLALSVDISSDIVRLIATASSNNWSVKVMRISM